MQLLLRRRIDSSGLSPRFCLWAKFDINHHEEWPLVEKYMVSQGYITIEATSRDAWRGAGLGFLAAVVIAFVISQIVEQLSYVQVGNNVFRTGLGNMVLNMPFMVPFIGFVFLWGLAGWLIFEQLRLAIKVSDLLGGREFKHRSLVLMARRERTMIGYAYCFKQLLEKMKDWEGAEVIEIGEEHEGALRLVTDVYAPS
jgi:hypothetical protein